MIKAGRHIASILLLASFLAGGLISPLAHSAWMWSMEEGDHAMNMASMTPPADSTTPSWDIPPMEECPYLALYNQAQQAADRDASDPVDCFQTAELTVAAADVFVGTQVESSYARGPPASA